MFLIYLKNHISSPRPESPSVQGEVKEEHFEATPQKQILILSHIMFFFFIFRKRKNSKTRENECPPKKIIENPAVTKKEDLIKKYKMYVHKCGVRKIW